MMICIMTSSEALTRRITLRKYVVHLMRSFSPHDRVFSVFSVLLDMGARQGKDKLQRDCG